MRLIRPIHRNARFEEVDQLINLKFFTWIRFAYRNVKPIVNLNSGLSSAPTFSAEVKHWKYTDSKHQHSLHFSVALAAQSLPKLS
jgi:hypothetical protein